jgi:hypothetical protein
MPRTTPLSGSIVNSRLVPIAVATTVESSALIATP